MDLRIERLNEVVLNLTTNDGEYEMRLQVEDCDEEPTLSSINNEQKQIVTIRMPINGMMLYKKKGEVKS